MKDLEEKLTRVRTDLQRASKSAREVSRAHDRLKSRPAVKFILMLREKHGKSGAPPTALALGAGLLQVAVEDLRGATDDLLKIYEANERLFGSDQLEKLLNDLDRTLEEIERDLGANRPRPDAVNLLNVAAAVANTVIAAYNTLH